MSSSKSSVSKRRANPTVDVVAAVLQSAATAVRSWTDEELEAFLAGDREMIIRVSSSPKARSRVSDPMRHAAEDVRSALGAMDSREAGMSYLEEMGFSREDLRSLVAALDLPANRSDNMDRLRRRVVEALIGYRLRSQAIRGSEPADSGGVPPS